MTVDYEIQSLWEWLLPSLGRTGALLEFTFMVAVICLIGVMAGYLCSALRHGFGEGFYRMAGVVVNSPRDIFRMGMGRILAMAMLAVQEAIRKKILIVFGIFVLFLLIAGWYLDQKNDRPAEIYLTFVLTATNFLIVLMSLFISAFSLPNDIKNRTIYTVVTKPVLASEIVVGRILGFTAVGTVMLALMGSVSYIFVVRGLSHQHDFVAENAEQEVEVQVERRLKLTQEMGRKVQQVEQAKNEEYQQLLAELEAQRQQAANKLIATTREADLYFIRRQAEGKALRDEQVTRAKANEVAYRQEAEALTAKIKAVGDQGPDVLNRVIAEEVFPQLEKVRATPFSRAHTPMDMRMLQGGLSQ